VWKPELLQTPTANELVIDLGVFEKPEFNSGKQLR
jgi:hypothetical protein